MPRLKGAHGIAADSFAATGGVGPRAVAAFSAEADHSGDGGERDRELYPRRARGAGAVARAAAGGGRGGARRTGAAVYRGPRRDREGDLAGSAVARFPAALRVGRGAAC